MRKFWSWLFDDAPEDRRPWSVIETEKAKKVEKKERGYYAETPEDIAASKEAKKDWDRREEEAFAAFKPKGPEFKIVQTPAGHFVIQRRGVQRRSALYNGNGDLHRWADEIKKQPVEPYEIYVTVKNPNAPIFTKEYSYSLTVQDRLTGYADLEFNLFEDAEAYLFRMAQPQNYEVGYDFPPLKRRAKPRKRTRGNAEVGK